MAKFTLSWVEDTDTSRELSLTLYRSALAARPAGRVNLPCTLIQLAAVYFA